MKTTYLILTFVTFSIVSSAQAPVEELFIKAQTFFDSNQYVQALEWNNKALSLLQKQPRHDDIQIARAYEEIGHCQARQRKFEEAQEAYQKSLELREENAVGNDSLLALSHYHLANNCYDLGKYDESISHAKASQSILLQLPEDERTDIDDVYTIEGIGYTVIGEFDKSIEAHKKALEVRVKLFGIDHVNTGNTLNNIGVNQMEKGDYKNALINYEKALVAYQKRFGDKHVNIGSFYLNVGGIHHHLADYEKALYCFEKSLSIFLDYLGPNHPYIGDIYGAIGSTMAEKLMYDKEIEYYLKGLEIYQSSIGETHYSTAAMYQKMGTHYYDVRNHEEALAHFQKSQMIHRKIFGEEYPRIAELYHQIGSCQQKLGHFDAAYANIERGLKLNQKLLGYVHPFVSFNYMKIGEWYADQGEMELALPWYDSSLYALNYRESNLESFENANSQIVVIEVLEQKAMVLDMAYQKSGDTDYLKSANKIYQTISENIDFIRREFEEEVSRQVIAQKVNPVFERSIKSNLAYAELVNEKKAKKNAFHFAEKGKSIILLDALRAADAAYFVNLPDSLLEREHNLNVDIAFCKQKQFEERQEQHSSELTKMTKWEERLFNLREERQQLINMFEQSYPEYYQLKYDQSLVTIEILQSDVLQPDEALLEYVVGDSIIYAFLITPMQFEVFEIARDFPLEEWTSILHRSLYSFQLKPFQSEEKYRDYSDTLVKYATRLHEKIMAPINAKFSIPEKLIIIPDGVLGYIPFDILVKELPEEATRFKTHHFLIHDHQISYCYSATLLEEMRKKVAKPGKTFLAVAPQFQSNEELASNDDILAVRSNLGPLIYNLNEARAIQKLTGGNILVAEEATQERFTQLASEYRILHLATHGKANDKAGDYSFLAFTQSPDSSQNDRLYASDLYNLQLNADLVVLSACETGIGELLKGEGIISLARGFSFAGAKSIVTTLWSVNDRATSELMQSFYHYLKDGKPKDESLRQAKLDYLNKHPNDEAHPFYWAAFVPVGDMAPVPFSNSIPWATILFTIIGLSIICYLLLRNRKQKTS